MFYEPHQERVVAELSELQSKIIKLKEFFKSDIYGGLPYEEQRLLTMQYNAMCLYSETLQIRIDGF